MNDSKASKAWVVRLPIADASALGWLRLNAGLFVLIADQTIWVRGDSIDSKLDLQLRSIPNAEWFSIHSGGLLTRRNETVPCERMPDGDWTPLMQWLEVLLPQSGFAVKVQDRVLLTLIRSSTPVMANLLRTTWPTWYSYAIEAPLIRLNRLGFAVSESREVLIRGVPQPPIPGRLYYEQHSIAIPCGWQFEPNVDTQVVRQLLGLDDESMALFAEDGTFEEVPISEFVQATRSSVRASDGK